MNYRLPDAEVSELIGLLEAMSLALKEGVVSLPALAESLRLDVDDIFPLMELLDILRLAHVSNGEIVLTKMGSAIAEGDIQEKKTIFSQHLMRYVPLARHIRRVLDERPGHRASEERFLRELEDFFSEEEAERVLKTIIDWGRYAEVFAYDFNTGILSLENPD
jgi:NitT/TauT family transport system ATP-binding protein